LSEQVEPALVVVKEVLLVKFSTILLIQIQLLVVGLVVEFLVVVVTVELPTESLDLVQKVVGQVHRLLVVVLVVLAGFVSYCQETTAVFPSTVPLGRPGATSTVRVNSRAPTLMEPLEQVTVPAAPSTGVVHVHPVGAASDRKVVPSGRVSDTEIEVVVSGPWLVTVRV